MNHPKHAGKEEQGDAENIGPTETKDQKGRFKFKHISNYDLNINGIKTLNKRQNLGTGRKDSIIYTPERHKEGECQKTENLHIANTKPNKDGVALLRSDKADLEVMSTTEMKKKAS